MTESGRAIGRESATRIAQATEVAAGLKRSPRRHCRRLACRLMIPINNDTLLRVVRCDGRPAAVPVTEIGIDDRAWKREQR
jgi:hypothetical protein